MDNATSTQALDLVIGDLEVDAPSETTFPTCHGMYCV